MLGLLNRDVSVQRGDMLEPFDGLRGGCLGETVELADERPVAGHAGDHVLATLGQQAELGRACRVCLADVKRAFSRRSGLGEGRSRQGNALGSRPRFARPGVEAAGG